MGSTDWYDRRPRYYIVKRRIGGKKRGHRKGTNVEKKNYWHIYIYLYAQSIVQLKEKGQPKFHQFFTYFSDILSLRKCLPHFFQLGFWILFLAKAFSFLDGKRHLLYELLVTLVRWQVQSIEAGVRAWQPRLFAHLLNTETLRSIAPWNKKKETFQWLIKQSKVSKKNKATRKEGDQRAGKMTRKTNDSFHHRIDAHRQLGAWCTVLT